MAIFKTTQGLCGDFAGLLRLKHEVHSFAIQMIIALS